MKPATALRHCCKVGPFVWILSCTTSVSWGSLQIVVNFVASLELTLFEFCILKAVQDGDGSAHIKQTALTDAPTRREREPFNQRPWTMWQEESSTIIYILIPSTLEDTCICFLFYIVLYTVVLALTCAVQKHLDSNKFWQCCIVFVTCCFQMILMVETSMVVLFRVADFCQHSRGEKLASESRDPPLVSIPKSCRILLNNPSLSPGDFQCQSSPSNPTDKGGGGEDWWNKGGSSAAEKKRNESFAVQRSLASLRSWSGEPPWSLKHLPWSHMRAYDTMNLSSMWMSVNHLQILFCIPYYPRRN